MNYSKKDIKEFSYNTKTAYAADRFPAQFLFKQKINECEDKAQ